MKTFKFSLVLCTHENTDVFITLDDNIYGIHSKRVNILYLVKQPYYIQTKLYTIILKNDHLWSFFNIIYAFLGSIFEPCYIQNHVITNPCYKEVEDYLDKTLFWVKCVQTYFFTKHMLWVLNRNP